MPTYPDPWEAQRSYLAYKAANASFEKQRLELVTNLLKQHREIESADERIKDLTTKTHDESLSQPIRDYHVNTLETVRDGRSRAVAWLNLNKAKLAQVETEMTINERRAGDLQMDLWTHQSERYEAFRKFLEINDYK